ncbi:MAG TPA: shikimate dehydrogenase [Arenimonas sp.]|uniref:shikimate dehydrogenase n=1 Tax=Arenimonas sp. TaxID=1872635 RepID=UPI002D7F37B3|nr:shikimate dehydrogenase [Arenimonas sp.]HEU0153230.1 shikimate dehydrogenase [Arenimonas sp.]
MTAHYAVFGHPVSHSLSPRIHAAFAKQAGIAMEYVAIDASSLDFASAVSAFATVGGRGANVTLPHKERALALCSELSARARRAGAVNTLTRVGLAWHGDNTDGEGLVRDLTGRHGQDLRARRVLLLGAGGAARGVAPALLDAGIQELWIVNRTPEKADALADALGEPDRVHTRYLDDLPNLGNYDMIVNATSAGRGDGALKLPFRLAEARALAVDLSYGEAAIPFLAWAKAAGCEPRIDGLGMLVEQAAESFALWHGHRPETDEVYAELRAHADALHTAD